MPLLADVAEISVSAKGSPGWFVRIWRDGDGCLVGGSLLSDGASFPRGTFDFRRVYDSFARAVLSVRPDADCFGVSFVTVTNPGYASTFFTRDAETVHLVFDTAKQHCVAGDAERFEKIWRERPPFPK